MSDRSRGVLGRASRGVLAEIDDKLSALDGELSTYDGLLAERDRLRAARAALTGDGPAPQISQDDVAAYLAAHPGSRAGVIASGARCAARAGSPRTCIAASAQGSSAAMTAGIYVINPNRLPKTEQAGGVSSEARKPFDLPLSRDLPLACRFSLPLRRSAGCRGASRTAGRAEHETLRRRDLEVLGWLGEQYGARVDQLELVIGCGPRTVRAPSRGYMPLVSCRPAGCSWGSPHGCCRRPRAWRCAVRDSVCGVPGSACSPMRRRSTTCACTCRAVPPRQSGFPSECLRRSVARGSIYPMAWRSPRARRVAIEVELTVKSRRRVTAILDELAGRFDAVLYFSAAGPHRQLTELADNGRWPTLGVRELPTQEGGEQRRLP